MREGGERAGNANGVQSRIGDGRGLRAECVRYRVMFMLIGKHVVPARTLTPRSGSRLILSAGILFIYMWVVCRDMLRTCLYIARTRSLNSSAPARAHTHVIKIAIFTALSLFFGGKPEKAERKNHNNFSRDDETCPYTQVSHISPVCVFMQGFDVCAHTTHTIYCSQ